MNRLINIIDLENEVDILSELYYKPVAIPAKTNRRRNKMTSYVFLGAIEAVAHEGYLSEKEIKKLTRIKKRKQKDSEKKDKERP